MRYANDMERIAKICVLHYRAHFHSCFLCGDLFSAKIKDSKVTLPSVPLLPYLSS
jgi:hypothetical protein